MVMADTEPAGQGGTRGSLFESLYARHHQAVLGYCFRRASWADAWDAASEVFVVAWRRLEEVPAGDDALPWLYAVAHKVLANQRRSQHRWRRLSERAARAGGGDASAPDVHVVRQEEAAEVLDALGRLSARDREIIQLALWEELKPAEIAHVFGISRPAVDQRLSRARQRLARELNRQASRWDLRSKFHLGTEV